MGERGWAKGSRAGCGGESGLGGGQQGAVAHPYCPHRAEKSRTGPGGVEPDQGQGEELCGLDGGAIGLQRAAPMSVQVWERPGGTHFFPLCRPGPGGEQGQARLGGSGVVVASHVSAGHPSQSEAWGGRRL